MTAGFASPISLVLVSLFAAQDRDIVSAASTPVLLSQSMHVRIANQARCERYLSRARELYIGRPGATGFVDYDLRRAQINIRRALMLDPNSYEALILAGEIAGELDESEQGLQAALSYYDRSMSLEPERPDAYEAKATALSDAQQYEAALAPARKAWRLTLGDQASDPFDVETTTVCLRDILVKLGRWDSACRVLKQGLARVPGSSWLLHLMDLTRRHIEWAPPEDAGQTKRLRRVR